jgi:ferritin-like protein
MDIKGKRMRDYHEPPNELEQKDRDYIRALKSLQEEVEAVDWYQQRIATTSNEELREILKHNRSEEMEHAAMTLEWLRRNMEGWNEVLKTCLFTTEKVTEVEEGSKTAGDLMVRSSNIAPLPPNGKEQ